MSKLQLFRDFINERLAAAALDIFGHFEETLSECQEEIRRSREKNAQLQKMLDIQPEIKLHRTDVLQSSIPEPPQIKEEQEPWTSQGGEDLQGLQSDTTDSIFTSPREKPHCDPEDSSQLPPLDQTPTVDNREADFLPTNKTEVQIKAESDEEDYGAPEPASDSQPPSVTPDCPTAQSLEKERELLPELTAYCRRRRVLKSPSKSRRTQVKCSRPVASPDTCSHPGTESEDGSSREAESKTAEKPYQCEECDKAFNNKGNLVVHRRVHTGEKPYQCEECDNAFNTKGNLVVHRRIHLREKPYQCEECDKAFHYKGHLVSHKRIHSGGKPYQCGECHKAFRSKGHLVVHRRIHSGEAPYQCEECHKAFNNKGNLVIHRRTHSGEKPYQCGECHKAFRQMVNLVSHKLIHTGEKPYQCGECHKAFRQRATLVGHRLIHTGEKPYQCEECDETFRKKGNLVRHRRSHMSETISVCGI